MIGVIFARRHPFIIPPCLRLLREVFFIPSKRDTMQMDDDADKYIVIGFDKSRKLLEILYNRIDNETINVFHAMKFRNVFLYLLDE